MQSNFTPLAEYRRDRRFSIDLNVYLSCGEAPARPYRMRNYCRSGVLLLAHTIPEQRGAACSSPFAVGQLVEVSGSVHHREGQEKFRFTAQIVRWVEDGFGAKFHRPEPRIFELLQGHTQNLRPRQISTTRQQPHRYGRSGTPITDARIQALLRKLGEQSLPASLHEVLKNTELELLAKFKNNPENFEKKQIVADLSRLDLAKSELDKHLLQPLLNRAVQQYRGDTELEQGDSLTDQWSLVDEAEFENWLHVVKASSKLDDTFSGQLHDLSLLIQALPANSHSPGKPEIPFSPLQITDQFSNLSAHLGLSPISHQHLLQTSVRVLSRELSKFYEELTSALQDLGVQPSPKSKPQHPAPRLATTCAETTCVEQSFNPEKRTPSAIGTRARAEAPTSVISISDLTRMLPQLEAEAVAGSPALPERLRQMAATSGGVELSPEAKGHAELAGQLLDFLYNDYRFSAQTASWIEAVQVPLVRAVLTDPDFFRSKDHPALQLVEQLEHICTFLTDEHDSPGQKRIRTSVEQTLARLRQSDGDERILAEVAQRLTELITAQSREYQRNVERLVANCTGQDQLRLSRIRLREELIRRYAGRRIPAVGVQLLDVGWRALLELTWLRHGEDTLQYRHYLSLFDEMVRRLGGDPYEGQASPLERAELLAAIKEGLASTASDPLRRTQVLARLNSSLLNLEKKTRTRVLELVPFPATAELSANTDPSAKKDIPESAWQRALDKVKSLEVGDRVTFSYENGGSQPLRVAWISAVNSRLVLVNQQGLKTKEISQSDLACSLHFGRVITAPAEHRILSEMTALEGKNNELRNMLEKLERSHEEISRHNVELKVLASHDPLTGCLNRRSFFEKFEAAFNEVQRNGGELSCIMVDIDHFKSINDRYGHATGDKVIKLVAGILQTKSRSEDLVGRYGGEEFCIIMPGLDIERATELAERLRQELHEGRVVNFTFDRRVTASFGVVSLECGAINPEDLINQADQALYVAKKNGRNQAIRFDHRIGTGTEQEP